MYCLKQIVELKEEKLIRFLNGRSAPNEKSEVEEWLDQPEAEKELEEIFFENWINIDNTDSGEEKQYLRMLEKVHRGISVKKKKTRNTEKWLKWTKMAASYLLLLASIYFIYQALQIQNPRHLTETKSIQVFERTTAAGEKLKITLPDQSKVIVNSLSTISFTSDFGKSERVVYLDGEAYFEITPDEDRSFKVQTGGVTTKALGTAFNAYFRNGQVKISLTEGQVMVSHENRVVELEPGKMALLDPDIERGFQIDTFDPDKAIAWKEGKIKFKSQSLGEILSELEDWYGVKFNIKGNLELRRKVTGLFSNDSLEDIMNGLSFSLNIKYSISGTTVIIQPDSL